MRKALTVCCDLLGELPRCGWPSCIMIACHLAHVDRRVHLQCIKCDRRVKCPCADVVVPRLFTWEKWSLVWNPGQSRIWGEMRQLMLLRCDLDSSNSLPSQWRRRQTVWQHDRALEQDLVATRASVDDCGDFLAPRC